MKIVLGIGHPADVLFFRRFIGQMKSRGHEVFVVAREKECARTAVHDIGCGGQGLRC